VVEEELITEVIDPLIPELYQLSLGILVPFACPGDEGV
jgi:hypothetical protein